MVNRSVRLFADDDPSALPNPSCIRTSLQYAGLDQLEPWKRQGSLPAFMRSALRGLEGVPPQPQNVDIERTFPSIADEMQAREVPAAGDAGNASVDSNNASKATSSEPATVAGAVADASTTPQPTSAPDNEPGFAAVGAGAPTANGPSELGASEGIARPQREDAQPEGGSAPDAPPPLPGDSREPAPDLVWSDDDMDLEEDHFPPGFTPGAAKRKTWADTEWGTDITADARAKRTALAEPDRWQRDSSQGPDRGQVDASRNPAQRPWNDRLMAREVDPAQRRGQDMGAGAGPWHHAGNRAGNHAGSFGPEELPPIGRPPSHATVGVWQAPAGNLWDAQGMGPHTREAPGGEGPPRLAWQAAREQGAWSGEPGREHQGAWPPPRDVRQGPPDNVGGPGVASPPVVERVGAWMEAGAWPSHAAGWPTDAPSLMAPAHVSGSAGDASVPHALHAGQEGWSLGMHGPPNGMVPVEGPRFGEPLAREGQPLHAPRSAPVHAWLEGGKAPESKGVWQQQPHPPQASSTNTWAGTEPSRGGVGARDAPPVVPFVALGGDSRDAPPVVPFVALGGDSRDAPPVVPFVALGGDSRDAVGFSADGTWQAPAGVGEAPPQHPWWKKDGSYSEARWGLNGPGGMPRGHEGPPGWQNNNAADAPPAAAADREPFQEGSRSLPLPSALPATQAAGKAAPATVAPMARDASITAAMGRGRQEPASAMAPAHAGMGVAGDNGVGLPLSSSSLKEVGKPSAVAPSARRLGMFEMDPARLPARQRGDGVPAEESVAMLPLRSESHMAHLRAMALASKAARQAQAAGGTKAGMSSHSAGPTQLPTHLPPTHNPSTHNPATHQPSTHQPTTQQPTNPQPAMAETAAPSTAMAPVATPAETAPSKAGPSLPASAPTGSRAAEISCGAKTLPLTKVVLSLSQQAKLAPQQQQTTAATAADSNPPTADVTVLPKLAKLPPLKSASGTPGAAPATATSLPTKSPPPASTTKPPPPASTTKPQPPASATKSPPPASGMDKGLKRPASTVEVPAGSAAANASNKKKARVDDMAQAAEYVDSKVAGTSLPHAPPQATTVAAAMAPVPGTRSATASTTTPTEAASTTTTTEAGQGTRRVLTAEERMAVAREHSDSLKRSLAAQYTHAQAALQVHMLTQQLMHSQSVASSCARSLAEVVDAKVTQNMMATLARAQAAANAQAVQLAQAQTKANHTMTLLQQAQAQLQMAAAAAAEAGDVHRTHKKAPATAKHAATPAVASPAKQPASAAPSLAVHEPALPGTPPAPSSSLAGPRPASAAAMAPLDASSGKVGKGKAVFTGGAAEALAAVGKNGVVAAEPTTGGVVTAEDAERAQEALEDLEDGECVGEELAVLLGVPRGWQKGDLAPRGSLAAKLAGVENGGEEDGGGGVWWSKARATLNATALINELSQKLKEKATFEMSGRKDAAIYFSLQWGREHSR
eukprot:jgi/Mesvir1/12678/Mv25774-RA.3